MSFAVKCDRCGNYFDKYGRKRFINGEFVRGIKIFTSGPYREFDLCENCVEDLYKFMGLDKEDIKNGRRKEEA